MDERKREREERRRRRLRLARLQRAILVLAVVLIAALLTAVFQRGGGNPELKLLGNAEVTLEYGSTYADAGARVFCDGAPVEAEIRCDGTVNPDVIGEYTLTYTAEYKGRTVSATRKVSVVDTQAPRITLVEIPGHCTEAGQEYEEEGYQAVDGYDGDLTDCVQIRTEGDTVIYTVTDASGNTATARRVIVYGDTTAPVITLQGGNTVIVGVGSAYREPGYSAADNMDGDLSANVHVTGSCDTDTPGDYVLTYTVTDAHGNTASVQRNVSVKKAIYLTFDDGPSEYTPRLLEILDKYDVKVTFFVVGTARLEYLDDIVEAGHAIGIHTDTHKYNKIYVSEDAFFQDFYAVREKIYEHTGIYTNLSRFPGGSSNGVSKDYCKGIMTLLTKAVEEKGFHYFDWNVDSDDAGGTKTAQGVYENVISGIRTGRANIVLQHDIFSYSVDAVEKIIQWGLENDYIFLPLQEESPNAHHPVNN